MLLDGSYIQKQNSKSDNIVNDSFQWFHLLPKDLFLNQAAFSSTISIFHKSAFNQAAFSVTVSIFHKSAFVIEVCLVLNFPNLRSDQVSHFFQNKTGGNRYLFSIHEITVHVRMAESLLRLQQVWPKLQFVDVTFKVAIQIPSLLTLLKKSI